MENGYISKFAIICYKLYYMIGGATGMRGQMGYRGATGRPGFPGQPGVNGGNTGGTVISDIILNTLIYTHTIIL
jgi:hypothetical protein